MKAMMIKGVNVADLVARHIGNGVMVIGKLKKEVAKDLPEGHGLSNTKLAAVCEQGLAEHAVKSRKGMVAHSIRTGYRFTPNSDGSAQGQQVQREEYRKGLSVADACEAAMREITRTAGEGKKEPKGAREVLLRARYMPPALGGFPLGVSDKLKAEVVAYTDKLKAADEAAQAAAEKAKEGAKEREAAKPKPGAAEGKTNGAEVPPVPAGK